MDEERDLQPIGNLAKTIGRSLVPSASTLTPSSLNSATTGAVSAGARASSSTGRGPSATAVARLPSVAQALGMGDSDEVRRAALRSLAPLLRSSLSSVCGSDWELEGFELTGQLPQDALPQLRALAATLNQRSMPELIVKHASRCLTVTKSREKDAVDLKLLLAILADELSEFPPDVVATAFRNWARREVWWPSLAEIRDACQREARWRRSFASIVR